MPDIENPAGDADSSGGFWPAIKKFFGADDGDRSLRAQLEEFLGGEKGECLKREFKILKNIQLT